MTEAAATGAMTEYETLGVVISGLAVLLSFAIVVPMWWGIREMMLAALQELLRRTSPPRPGPAE